MTPTARTINGDWQTQSPFTISPQPRPERERALTRWLRSQSATRRTWPTITVKSTDATHPQNGMSFGDLGETDLMEIGAGQHGEGGGVRVPVKFSKETVATVAEALYRNLELKADDRAFVMINGCGATTMMEMLVLFKDTRLSS